MSLVAAALFVVPAIIITACYAIIVRTIWAKGALLMQTGKCIFWSLYLIQLIDLYFFKQIVTEAWIEAADEQALGALFHEPKLKPSRWRLLSSLVRSMPKSLENILIVFIQTQFLSCAGRPTSYSTCCRFLDAFHVRNRILPLLRSCRVWHR